MENPGTRSESLLVIDDSEVTAEVLRRQLEGDGYHVDVAYDGSEGLAKARRLPPDLVVLDVMMPGMDGFEVCRRLKADPATRLTPVVLVTTLEGRENRMAGVEAGADDYLTKPVVMDQLRECVRGLLRVKRHTDGLESAEQVILELARSVEARDPATQGHCDRLAAYASLIGAELAMSAGELEVLKRGALLHDIGKMAIPDAILLNPGGLTPEEYALMQSHTTVGEQLCADFQALRQVRSIVRHHHERLDGSGYPDGLVGAQVSFLAQIVGLVDVLDGLTTPRPYKPSLTLPQAVGFLRQEAARGMHNPMLVHILEAALDRGDLHRVLTTYRPPALGPGGL